MGTKPVAPRNLPASRAPDGIPACARGRRGRVSVPQHAWRRALAVAEVAAQAGGLCLTLPSGSLYTQCCSLGKVPAKCEVCLPQGLGQWTE